MIAMEDKCFWGRPLGSLCYVGSGNLPEERKTKSFSPYPKTWLSQELSRIWGRPFLSQLYGARKISALRSLGSYPIKSSRKSCGLLGLMVFRLISVPFIFLP
ncbi:hypothetical protein I314_02542 [Cryptococcus bacillisporus CA1873]|uniref:Uncharacterized protein n=1 Tax=Cryptococcus bacillisporus CA1873 TaxID=1296111 RepID=A0ABR5BDT8_CRYGA|nr:hypothetical protein I314_02542 [Cryptococcus bacillisporus CA1873]|eukprot:KIR67324.1 hypothetical protein I314_02542 [Cryptococcus gattii CA1873]